MDLALQAATDAPEQVHTCCFSLEVPTEGGSLEYSDMRWPGGLYGTSGRQRVAAMKPRCLSKPQASERGGLARVLWS